MVAGDWYGHLAVTNVNHRFEVGGFEGFENGLLVTFVNARHHRAVIGLVDQGIDQCEG